jgi:hypothetical protein
MAPRSYLLWLTATAIVSTALYSWLFLDVFKLRLPWFVGFLGLTIFGWVVGGAIGYRTARAYHVATVAKESQTARGRKLVIGSVLVSGVTGVVLVDLVLVHRLTSVATVVGIAGISLSWLMLMLGTQRTEAARRTARAASDLVRMGNLYWVISIYLPSLFIVVSLLDHDRESALIFLVVLVLHLPWGIRAFLRHRRS